MKNLPQIAISSGAVLLDLSSLRIDGGTQPRAQIDQLVVDDYAEAITRGDELPPLEVFYDGENHWLADGFHRRLGALAAGLEQFRCRVHQGTQRDAVLCSVGANASHGLRRTSADKRRAVETLLRDEEWSKWSNRRIADVAAVSPDLVDRIRPSICLNQADTVTVERNGKRYEMKTENIGQKLTPEARRAILDSPIRDDQAEMKRLAQLPRREQAAVAQRVSEGRAPDVKTAAVWERQDRERAAAEDVDEEPVEGEDAYPCDPEDATPQPVLRAIPNRPAGSPARPSSAPPAPAAPPFPTARSQYSIVYADPPWHYNDRRNKHTRFCGGAAAHYLTMRTDEICALPVKDIVTSDAFLFLWATWPTLDDAFRVIEAWGFEYVTCGFNWIKTNSDGTPFFGIGYYTKSNSEVCLLATRGEPWVISNDVSQVIMSARQEHSRKPAEVRDLIVELLGDVPRIELFARESAPGWDCWGNQAPEPAEALGVEQAAAERPSERASEEASAQATVACPNCWALPGQNCVTGGVAHGYIHLQRLEAFLGASHGNADGAPVDGDTADNEDPDDGDEALIVAAVSCPVCRADFGVKCEGELHTKRAQAFVKMLQCPSCKSTAKRCKRPSGHEASEWHSERKKLLEAARQQFLGTSAEQPPAGPACYTCGEPVAEEDEASPAYARNNLGFMSEHQACVKKRDARPAEVTPEKCTSCGQPVDSFEREDTPDGPMHPSRARKHEFHLCFICNEIVDEDAECERGSRDRLRHVNCGSLEDQCCAWCGGKVPRRQRRVHEGNLVHFQCWENTVSECSST